tara:strand:+ start:2946 stop:3299 length:354 start_codon:yes stop_codon:yes gene_type:complete
MEYFKIEEFESPDLPGSGEFMDPVLLEMLDHTRMLYGKPINISSGYRTIAHNKEVGGVPTSSHLLGLAVDIRCANSRERFDLINVLLKKGFNRIGVGSTFIHVDIDLDKSPNVIWTY